MKTFKKIGKKVSDIFLTTFVFLALPVILVILVTSRTNILFGIKSYIIQTGSMQPRLPIGSVVFTVPRPPYQIGQIITFNRGDITVTHRIVGIRNDQFQTKGDANSSADPQLVNKGDVIGTDFLTVPYLGGFVRFIKTVPGFLLIIAFPNLIFIFFELWNVKEEYKKEIERKVLQRFNLV